MPSKDTEQTGQAQNLQRVLCWNLYHGRDAPPDPSLRTLRSRLLGVTEDDGTYLQVNRSLRDEFTELVAAAPWSVCLLQEAPPSWAPALAARSGAAALRCLTSRNQLGPMTALLARWNPDLVGSWEGGSNQTLVRRPWRPVEGERRSLLLNPYRERHLRERRRMSFVRLRSEEHASELCVANLHASHYSRHQAERELLRAARAAIAWSRDAPLVLGGDFNVRPRSADLFTTLKREFGLAPQTDPDAIDHILVRGLELVRPPARWPAERRDVEVPWGPEKRRIRLSDHSPVEAMFRLPAAGVRY